MIQQRSGLLGEVDVVAIKIIIGSTRPGRFGPKAAAWVYDIAKNRDDAKFEVVDLKEVNLPFFDEEKHPVQHEYAHEHTKRWARIVERHFDLINEDPTDNLVLDCAVTAEADYLVSRDGHLLHLGAVERRELLTRRNSYRCW